MMHSVRTVISVSYTDGEEMYDDEYEVGGMVELCRADNGWADQWSVSDIRFSGPGGDLNTSSAIMHLLPSYALGDAEDALVEAAQALDGCDYDRDELLG